MVDLKMMKEELKQLEDPPLTAWEKEICSNRLPYSFFNCPCEELAQNLLGNIANYLVLLTIQLIQYTLQVCSINVCLYIQGKY